MNRRRPSQFLGKLNRKRLEELARSAEVELPKVKGNPEKAKQKATLFEVVAWAEEEFHRYLLSAKDAEPGTLVKVDTQTPQAIFWHSTTVTALNPKSIGFFIAFVPQFIDPSRVLAPQFAIMIATFVGLAATNAFLFALAADRLRSVITRPSVITWLTRAGGLTLIAMAALTATLRRAT